MNSTKNADKLNFLPTSFFKNTLLFTCLIISFSSFATSLDYPNTTKLRIGVAGSAPFIFQNRDRIDGISIEIWEALSSQADWNYTPIYFENVSDALDALTDKKLDVVVGPISITSERAKRVRFSQPYYQSSLSIMSRSEEPTFWERIEPFFSMKLVLASSSFLFILTCVGTLLWLAERKASPDQFSYEPAKGIGSGMWLAIVTMTTTGYGDKAPITLMGRIITACWMVISIIFATSMVAGIASTLTLTGLGNDVITTAPELAEKKVAVLTQSPSVEFVRKYRGKTIFVETMENAYNKLKNKEVDAIVFDRPQLQYFRKYHPDEGVIVSSAEYVRQGYGFAVPLDSPLTHDINVFLLSLNEQGRLNRILGEWLDADEITQ